MPIHAILQLIGQVVLGMFFVLTGVNQVVDADRLAEWTGSKGVPFASIVVYITALGLIGGGVAVIADPFVEQNTITIGVAILIVLLLVITPIMHDFWKIDESDGIYPVKATDGGEAYILPPQPSELFNFLQNIALIGALLALL